MIILIVNQCAKNSSLPKTKTKNRGSFYDDDYNNYDDLYDDDDGDPHHHWQGYACYCDDSCQKYGDCCPGQQVLMDRMMMVMMILIN